MEEKEITIELRHPEVIFLIAFLTIALILELQVTLGTHIVFGDEGTHASMSLWMAEEIDYPVWQPFAGTNLQRRGDSYPPLWHLLGAGFLFVFGNSDAVLKVLPPLIGTMLTGLAVFALAKKIYNSKVAVLSSVIAVTVPAYVTYSVLYYTDVLVSFYFFLSALTLVLAIKEDSKKYWILSGVFGGLAFLTKSSGLAIFIVWMFCFLYQLLRREKFSKIIKNYLILAALAALLVLPFFARGYYYYGNPSCNLPMFPFFSTAGCNYDVAPKPQYNFEGVTEQVGTEQSISTMGIMNYLIFSYGNVWFVFFALLAGLVLLTWRREVADVLILLVIASLFFIVVRDYSTRAENMARYLLEWTPILAIVAGSYFAQVSNFISSHLNKIVALSVFVFVLFFSTLNITCPWPFTAQKCQELGMGMKTTVMVQVKQFSPLFFEACDWIKTNLDKDVRLGNVVWAGATLYNCERNVGGGTPDLVIGRNLTLALPVMRAEGVTHVFVQKFSISYTDQKFSEKYPISFIDFIESHPEVFQKVYENGPSISECKQAGGCDGTILYKVNYNSTAQ